MNQQPVVLFMPINAPGHINTGITLADRLSKADLGYRCVFVIVGRQIGDKIVGHGHELIELPEIKPQVAGELDGAHNSGGVENIWTEHVREDRNGLASSPRQALESLMKVCSQQFFPRSFRNFHQYDQVVERLKPALICVDNFFAPPVVLRKQKQIPWVRIHSPNPMDLYKRTLPGNSGPAAWLGHQLFTRQERDRLRQEQPNRWQEILAHWREHAMFVEAAYAHNRRLLVEYYDGLGLNEGHLDHTRQILHCNSPHLNLYLCPEALDYCHDGDLFEPLPPHFVQCNSLVRQSSLSQAQQKHWLQLIEQKSLGKEARVLFSLGSIASGDAELVQRYVNLLAQDQRRLYIVSKGIANEESVQLDERNMIGAAYIPQPFLLQHVQLAIVHGGNNGITECLHNGVPLIVVPMFGDQFDNAQRVADMQLGLRLNLQQCSQAQLLGAVDQLLADRELRRRVSLVGAKMRARNDVERVCQMLHSLAESKRVSNDGDENSV